jgi:hypothetical protein
VGGAVGGGPGGWQEGVEFFGPGAGEAFDERLEVGLRIDAVIAGADEQGILPRINICGNEIFSLMFLPPIILGSSDDRNPPH